MVVRTVYHFGFKACTRLQDVGPYSIVRLKREIFVTHGNGDKIRRDSACTGTCGNSIIKPLRFRSICQLPWRHRESYGRAVAWESRGSSLLNPRGL